MVGGGISLPWNLALCAVIGAWLMLSRLVLGTDDATANLHHLIGAMVLTTTAIATGEVARSVRFLSCVWAVALLSDLLLRDETAAVQAASVIAGLALLVLSLPRGPVRHRYAGWNVRIL